METDQERGSVRLLREMFGDRMPESHADVAKAFGVDTSGIKLWRWWWKGQPRPDWFYGTFEVPIDQFGDIASRFVKRGIVLDSIGIGVVAIDSVLVNVSNMPHGR